MVTNLTGNLIRWIRESAGLTQAALAGKIGKSSKLVSKLEKGRVWIKTPDDLLQYIEPALRPGLDSHTARLLVAYETGWLSSSDLNRLIPFHLAIRRETCIFHEGRYQPLGACKECGGQLVCTPEGHSCDICSARGDF